ncbi:hypothetical protein [Brumimicrobium mesophilum]|uniref:hypothetical protein n=1 Tax=Brumimicrobium mesophilum TaxID=392717 RepID=UPI000D13F6BD|nr:hypothetical protein [Brumimicrobium mesophilum]
MTENSPQTTNSNKKKEFDYFLTVINNWKLIFTVCLVLAIVSVSVFLIIPKPQQVKTSFAISLPQHISTAYGTYYLKTTNPEHYLAKVERKLFKERVLQSLGLADKKGLKLELGVDRQFLNSNMEVDKFPNKFDLVSSDPDASIEDLVKVNKAALNKLLDESDASIIKDMVHQFKVILGVEISNLKFSIETKKELIADVKNELDLIKGTSESASNNNIKKMADSYLLSNIEDGEKGIIISMLLNEDKGNEYYLTSMLSLEKVSLNRMVNGLSERERLLEKLKKNVENDNFNDMFKKPFSNSILVLSSSQPFDSEGSGSMIKIILIVLFVGFISSVSYVLVREYYA